MERIVVKKSQRGFVKLYDVYEIGCRRMKELNLRTNEKIAVSIDVSYLGLCSIKKIPVIVAMKKLTDVMVWKIVPYTNENIRKYWGHCYIVRGKQIVHVGGRCYGTDIQEAMLKYEAEETGRPASMLNAQEIFRDAMGCRCKKKPHISGSRKPTAHGTSGTIGAFISTKRFNNSKITCVCKTRNYN